MAWKCINETNYDKEDTVIVPIHVRKELHLMGVDGIDGAEVPSELSQSGGNEKVE